MWIFTESGFYSVVQKPGEDRLTVRARLEGDLERLRERMPTLGPTVVTPEADYRFRAIISHADFAAGMLGLVEDLRYSNFKSHVRRTMGAERADLYHRVWDVMHDAQEKEASSRRRQKKGVAPR